jgi:hypothetical protein
LVLDQDKQCIAVIDMAIAYYGFCPCKGCNERKVGCHASCVAYKEWKKNSVEIVKDDYFPFDKKKARRIRR